MKRVLSFGGGVQTVALGRMILKGEIEKPDLAIFADTQNEPEGVYRAVAREMRLFEEAGIETARVSQGNLGDWRGNGSIHVPLFTISLIDRWVEEELEDGTVGQVFKPAGSEGKLMQTCSSRFKADPIAKHLEERGWKSEGVQMMLGITTDEAVRRMRPNKRSWIENTWPLTTEFGFARGDCEAILNKAGLPLQKSACYFCPFKNSPTSLKRLSPNDKAKAIAYDEDIRHARPEDLSFTHQTRRPLKEVLADDELQLELGLDCEEGYCAA